MHVRRLTHHTDLHTRNDVVAQLHIIGSFSRLPSVFPWRALIFSARSLSPLLHLQHSLLHEHVINGHHTSGVLTRARVLHESDQDPLTDSTARAAKRGEIGSPRGSVRRILDRILPWESSMEVSIYFTSAPRLWWPLSCGMMRRARSLFVVIYSVDEGIRCALVCGKASNANTPKRECLGGRRGGGGGGSGGEGKAMSLCNRETKAIGPKHLISSMALEERG